MKIHIDKDNTENITKHKTDDQECGLNLKKSHSSRDKEIEKEKNRNKLPSSLSESSKSLPTPIPLKNVKPLTDNTESQPNKPFSKVLPLATPIKSKKQVRFSNAPDEVIVFEIEPGNIMRKTSSVKTRLVDARKMPIFSLEKITLMKILRWNPQWLDEQKSNVDPPPILGHDNPPMAIFHNFNSHSQYVGYVLPQYISDIFFSALHSIPHKKLYDKGNLTLTVDILFSTFIFSFFIKGGVKFRCSIRNISKSRQ